MALLKSVAGDKSDVLTSGCSLTTITRKAATVNGAGDAALSMTRRSLVFSWREKYTARMEDDALPVSMADAQLIALNTNIRLNGATTRATGGVRICQALCHMKANDA